MIVAIYNDCNKDIERTVEVLCSLSKNNDCAENAPSVFILIFQRFWYPLLWYFWLVFFSARTQFDFSTISESCPYNNFFWPSSLSSIGVSFFLGYRSCLFSDIITKSTNKPASEWFFSLTYHFSKESVIIYSWMVVIVSPKFNVWPKYPGPIQAAVTKFVQTKLHNMNRFEKQQLRYKTAISFLYILISWHEHFSFFRSMMQQRVKQYLQNHSQYVNQDTTKILPIYLTDQQKRQFIEQGYLVIDNIVSNNLTNAALRYIISILAFPSRNKHIFWIIIHRAINWSIGKGIPPERMSFFKLKSFCPELMCSEVMLNLFFNSSAPNVVKALLDNFRFPFISQIALR